HSSTLADIENPCVNRSRAARDHNSSEPPQENPSSVDTNAIFFFKGCRLSKMNYRLNAAATISRYFITLPQLITITRTSSLLGGVQLDRMLTREEFLIGPALCSEKNRVQRKYPPQPRVDFPLLSNSRANDPTPPEQAPHWCRSHSKFSDFHGY